MFTDDNIQEHLDKYNIKRRIVCAAVRFKDDEVVCSARHYDPRMHKQIELMGPEYVKFWAEEQGFIDQFGLFLNRVDAMEIVKDNGQPFNYVRNGDQDEELYSEGLY